MTNVHFPFTAPRITECTCQNHDFNSGNILTKSLIRQVNRWQKTAGSDLKVAKWLLRLYEESHYHSDELDSPPYNWICFISFDCIEKALKATMIAGQILKEEDLHNHNIYNYVDRLARKYDREFERLRRKLSSVKYFYYKTRWPNTHKGTCTPGDHITEKDAKAFLQIAAEVLCAVDQLLPTFF